MPATGEDADKTSFSSNISSRPSSGVISQSPRTSDNNLHNSADTSLAAASDGDGVGHAHSEYQPRPGREVGGGKWFREKTGMQTTTIQRQQQQQPGQAGRLEGQKMTSPLTDHVTNVQSGDEEYHDVDDEETAASQLKISGHSKSLTPFSLRNRRDDAPFALVKPIDDGRRSSGSQSTLPGVGVSTWCEPVEQQQACESSWTDPSGADTSGAADTVGKQHAGLESKSQMSSANRGTTPPQSSQGSSTLGANTLHASTMSLPERTSPRPRATIFGDIRERVFGAKQSAVPAKPVTFFDFLTKKNEHKRQSQDGIDVQPEHQDTPKPRLSLTGSATVTAEMQLSTTPDSSGPETPTTKTPAGIPSEAVLTREPISSGGKVTEEQPQVELPALAPAINTASSAVSTDVSPAAEERQQIHQSTRPGEPLKPVVTTERTQHAVSMHSLTGTGGSFEETRLPARDQDAKIDQHSRRPAATAQVLPLTKSNQRSYLGMQYERRPEAKGFTSTSNLLAIKEDEKRRKALQIAAMQASVGKTPTGNTRRSSSEVQAESTMGAVDSGAPTATNAGASVTRSKTATAGMSRVDWAKQRFGSSQPLDMGFATGPSDEMSPRLPRRSTNAASHVDSSPMKAEDRVDGRRTSAGSNVAAGLKVDPPFGTQLHSILKVAVPTGVQQTPVSINSSALKTSAGPAGANLPTRQATQVDSPTKVAIVHSLQTSAAQVSSPAQAATTPAPQNRSFSAVSPRTPATTATSNTEDRPLVSTAPPAASASGIPTTKPSNVAVQSQAVNVPSTVPGRGPAPRGAAFSHASGATPGNLKFEPVRLQSVPVTTAQRPTNASQPSTVVTATPISANAVTANLGRPAGQLDTAQTATTRLPAVPSMSVSDGGPQPAAFASAFPSPLSSATPGNTTATSVSRGAVTEPAVPTRSPVATSSIVTTNSKQSTGVPNVSSGVQVAQVSTDTTSNFVSRGAIAFNTSAQPTASEVAATVPSNIHLPAPTATAITRPTSSIPTAKPASSAAHPQVSSMPAKVAPSAPVAAPVTVAKKKKVPTATLR